MPPGSLGALQVQQETPPLANDAIAYAYDALGRLASRTVTGQGAETFGYDTIGRLTSHAGDLGSFTLAWLGQTGQIASRTLAGSSLATSWTYLANANDRRLASVATTGTLLQSTSFAYTTNAQNEVTGLSQTSDAAIATPAVSTQSASYNNLNQLTNLGGQALTFDADGNLTSDGTRTYSWDAENRLVAIAYPHQSGKATSFSYDGLGRRIQGSSTPVGGGSATVTNYIWCGPRLCQARNSSNAVIRGYYAEGEYTPGGFSHDNDYAPDRLGSVRRVFTTLSSSTNDYDAYGAALQTTAPTTDFGYAGTVTNTDSGLYLTTRRPYDPVTGRFLTRDPIGEAGDPQANLYAYVGGDPVNLSDPAGRATVNLGVNLNGILPANGLFGPAGTAYAGFVCDEISCGWYYGGGVGGGYGPGASLSLSMGISSAPSKGCFGGKFNHGTGAAGEGVVVGGSGYTGVANGKPIFGAEGSIGLGVGSPISFSGGQTYTSVIPW